MNRIAVACPEVAIRFLFFAPHPIRDEGRGLSKEVMGR